jgi:hypothetical protein
LIQNIVILSLPIFYGWLFFCLLLVGLAAYVFTNNIQRSWRVSEALEYGIVGINEGVISTEVGLFSSCTHQQIKK